MVSVPCKNSLNFAGFLAKRIRKTLKASVKTKSDTCWPFDLSFHLSDLGSVISQAQACTCWVLEMPSCADLQGLDECCSLCKIKSMGATEQAIHHIYRINECRNDSPCIWLAINHTKKEVAVWCLLHEKCGIISSVCSTGCIKSWALSETDGKLRNGLQWLDFHIQGLYHLLLYVANSLQLQWALVCIWMIVCSFKAF